MTMYKVFLFVLLGISSIKAQETAKDSVFSFTKKEYLKPKFSQVIIPAILIGYGVFGLENHNILDLNREVREEVNEHIDKKITIDDFSQYAPAASVYVLNSAGIDGENNFRDRTIVIGTSYLIMSTTVLGLKSITKVRRPDGSSKNSFPSGHTATAFAGAEFLWQEYKDQSIWYGIGCYAIATGTGLFRVYNNRHWMTDVVAGAGIGILSTKIAYWLYPAINKKVFGSRENKDMKISVIPFYNGNQIGLSISKTF